MSLWKEAVVFRLFDKFHIGAVKAQLFSLGSFILVNVPVVLEIGIHKVMARLLCNDIRNQDGLNNEWSSQHIENIIISFKSIVYRIINVYLKNIFGIHMPFTRITNVSIEISE